MMTRNVVHSSSIALSVCLLLAGGCKSPLPGDEAGTETGDGDGDTTGDGDGDGDGDPTGDGDGDPTGDGDGDPTGDGDGDPGCAAALDILLVVDNSGTMGEAQRRLTLALPSLIGPLDAVGIDWRVGVTTTDNGNPWCPAGMTTPEAGKLVLSSCKARINDFLFADIADARDLACNDLCELDEVPLVPTSTEVDPNSTPRPWIERIDGQTNLADGVTVEQALPCVVPQGINGCGFEAQLESSYLALLRAQTNSEASYGFLRAGASLLVLILSDEVDCSYNKNWSSIFNPDGNRVFWSDPSAPFPTSALCWNAGVQCEGDPSSYSSCDPQDYDVDGEPTNEPAAAVLHPLSRYSGLLAGLQEQKQQLDPAIRARVTVIAGVGLDGVPVYADAADPQFQDSYGIGPGCGSPGDIEAVPPVRMRDIALATNGLLGSICASDYSSLLTDAVTPFLAACD